MVKVKLNINGKEIELSAEDIKSLRQILDALDGGEIRERVVTVPYYVPCTQPTWPQYPYPTWYATNGYVSTGTTFESSTLTFGGTNVG